MKAHDTNKRYLVVGAGKTGQSVVRYLTLLGASLAVVDSRDTPPGLDQSEYSDVEIFTGGFDRCNFTGYDVLVVSPGISVHLPEIVEARQCGSEVIGDIELFARELNARNPTPSVIAVTGSNGKSTVVSMLGSVLLADNKRVAVGGNLGTPALDLLAQSPDADIYVLELSSFQLETTHSLRSDVSAVLNVSEDHMDRYESLTEYADVKRRIFSQSERAVYNADDALTRPPQFAHSTAFGSNAEFTLKEGSVARGGNKLFDTNELRVPGQHNIENVLATVSILKSLTPRFDVSSAAIRVGLINFTGLPHRTQWVANDNGVDWYNDSKGTNVGATLAAVKGMGRPVVLIAGGDGKGADFSPLIKVYEHCRAAVLFGRDAPLIADVLRGKVNTVIESGMRAAVVSARRLACSGDAVLLSPACASFDMYRSYEARGEDFVTTVREVLA